MPSNRPPLRIESRTTVAVNSKGEMVKQFLFRFLKNIRYEKQEFFINYYNCLCIKYFGKNSENVDNLAFDKY